MSQRVPVFSVSLSPFSLRNVAHSLPPVSLVIIARYSTLLVFVVVAPFGPSLLVSDHHASPFGLRTLQSLRVFLHCGTLNNHPPPTVTATLHPPPLRTITLHRATTLCHYHPLPPSPSTLPSAPPPFLRDLAGPLPRAPPEDDSYCHLSAPSPCPLSLTPVSLSPALAPATRLTSPRCQAQLWASRHSCAPPLVSCPWGCRLCAPPASTTLGGAILYRIQSALTPTMILLRRTGTTTSPSASSSASREGRPAPGCG